LCTTGRIYNRCTGFVATRTAPNAKRHRVLVLALCVVLSVAVISALGVYSSRRRRRDVISSSSSRDSSRPTSQGRKEGTYRCLPRQIGASPAWQMDSSPAVQCRSSIVDVTDGFLASRPDKLDRPSVSGEYARSSPHETQTSMRYGAEC